MNAIISFSLQAPDHEPSFSLSTVSVSYEKSTGSPAICSLLPSAAGGLCQWWLVLNVLIRLLSLFRYDARSSIAQKQHVPTDEAPFAASKSSKVAGTQNRYFLSSHWRWRPQLVFEKQSILVGSIVHPGRNQGFCPLYRGLITMWALLTLPLNWE